MKIKIICLMLTAALAACSDSDTDSSAENNSSARQALKASCISAYSEKPCSLLTTEIVKKGYPELSDAAEINEIKQIQSCSYSWPGNGRKKMMEVMGRKIEIPVSNEIGIKWIKQKNKDTALSDFKNSYRTLSEEEKAKAAEQMQRMLDKRSEGLSQSQKKMASGMTKGFLKNMKYEQIAGVGTAAAWGGVGTGSSLKVLDGDTEFEIVANISDLAADNKKLAITMAGALIESCQ